ncbi:hypothetical protein XENORESO_018729 [Xenotaenia resolanae]|uniref:Uncharacterized protein n=1 Tax=Xenotaenia resolanae TaxID=208358 RepID=A0ABV0X6P5_9TELE
MPQLHLVDDMSSFCFTDCTLIENDRNWGRQPWLALMVLIHTFITQPSNVIYEASVMFNKIIKFLKYTFSPQCFKIQFVAVLLGTRFTNCAAHQSGSLRSRSASRTRTAECPSRSKL